MPSFSQKSNVPGKDQADKKPQAAPQMFKSDSTFAPPKEKNKVGVSGFGRDDSKNTVRGASGFRKRDVINPYAEEVQKHEGSGKRGYIIAIMVVALVVVFFAVLILPYGLLDNPKGVSLSGIVASVSRNIHDLAALFTNRSGAGSEEIILSRYLCVVLAGASLGVTGAVYQGSLKNALASPTTLGVDTGATCGATVYVLLFGTLLTSGSLTMQASELSSQIEAMSFTEYAWFYYGRAICAIIGAFVIIGLVLIITRLAGHGQINGMWLIVTGTIIATMISSVRSVMTQYFTEMGMTQEERLLESITTQSFTEILTLFDVVLVAVPTLICLVMIFALRIKLGLLTFGDDEARSMGVNPPRLRTLAIGITTVMTAVITAFCGNIAFLGFLVPHITRRFIGSDFRYLLPASALSGSLILLVCYYSMTIFSSSGGNYTGLLTSVVGFVVFIVMFIKQRGVGRRVQTQEA